MEGESVEAALFPNRLVPLAGALALFPKSPEPEDDAGAVPNRPPEGAAGFADSSVALLAEEVLPKLKPLDTVDPGAAAPEVLPPPPNMDDPAPKVRPPEAGAAAPPPPNNDEDCAPVEDELGLAVEALPKRDGAEPELPLALFPNREGLSLLL